MIDDALSLYNQASIHVSEKNSLAELKAHKLTEEQKVAYDHLIARGNLKCVVGFAGTGKSYLLGAAHKFWETEGYQVMGATLSGIAAESLANSSGIESRTLASLFHRYCR